MAIRRKKVDRDVGLEVNEHDRVVDLPPGWSFTIRCKQSAKDYSFDFEPLCRNGREGLAAQMRDAIWSMREALTGNTLKGYWNMGLPIFWDFLDALEGIGQPVTRLDQIDRWVIDQFIAWMDRQICQKGRNKCEPWSTGAKKTRYSLVKALLVNRQKTVPEACNPDLTFPKNPYPSSNRKAYRREPYSPAEQNRILAALKQDLARVKEDPGALPPGEVLAVHAAIIAFLAGVNLTPLLEARRDALKPFLPDRELLEFHKRRGYSTHVQSYRKDPMEADKQFAVCPGSVGDFFRQLCAFTEPLAGEAEDGGYVFLYRMPKGGNSKRLGQVVRMDENHLNNALSAFTKRHGLVDDHGQRLQINLARLRPTFGRNLYLRTRDIRKVQQALGHSDPNTTVQRYLPAVTPEATRDHKFVGEAMVGWAREKEEDEQAGKLAADGQIPLEDAEQLLKGGYNTAIARCKNPFRSNGETCPKYLACFRCPSMVVFEDDLCRLFSFYERLLSERAKIAPHHWMRTYGWVLRLIDEDIAPQFDPETVDEARRKAREAPHPTWAGGRPLA